MKRDTWKLFSWNVNGIRAAYKKGFWEWLQSADADIVCVQETRAHPDQVRKDKMAKHLMRQEEYEIHWHSAEKAGYSGVATFTRHSPLRVETGFQDDHPGRHFNDEGRVVITEFPAFELWNVYFPNGGRGPERVRYKLDFYDYCLSLWEERRKRKPLILAGDFNTAHKEIDLARPAENQTTSGFLPEEREFLDRIVSMGYVDLFRRFHQEGGWYTYWDMITRARERNVGWRIDYFFATEEALPLVKDVWILTDVMGSDHCPVGLELYVHG